MWPTRTPGDQQMMLHLDIQVDDLAGETERAVALGATLHDHQPQDDVRVLLDPCGHPFCLWREERGCDPGRHAAPSRLNRSAVPGCS